MSMVLRGIYIVWYRELLRFIRERSRMISAIAMPVLFLVIFGEGFKNSMGSLAPGVDFIKFMYPGIIAMSVLMTSFMSGMSVVWDREFGFLKEVLVSPLSRSGVALGKTLGGATVAMIQGVLLLVLAPIVGMHLTPLLVLKLIPLMLLLAITTASLGILIASRMQSLQSFQMVMQVLVFPMIFLSGVFFPVNNVPVWLEVLVKINPVTYGVDAIRQLFLELFELGGASQSSVGELGVCLWGHCMSILEDVGIVVAFGAVALTGATWSFEKQG
jgi:ABC-2 type transport system permease protein